MYILFALAFALLPASNALSVNQNPPSLQLPTNRSTLRLPSLNATARRWPLLPFYHEFTAGGYPMSITITQYGSDAEPSEEEDIKHSIWDILWSIYGDTKEIRKGIFTVPQSISRGDVRATFWGDIRPLPPVTRAQVGQLMDEVYYFVLDYGPREIASARIEIGGKLAMWFELEYWTPAAPS